MNGQMRAQSPKISYRTHTVKGRQVFYREAGETNAKTILLLHGFPSSSHMFRDLIPLLAERFRVIAPDYIGFGYSEAPSADDFAYSFDALADHVEGLVEALSLKSYVVFMHDYGGSIGMRLFYRRPDSISGLVIQNANAYMVGVSEKAKDLFMPLWAKRDAASESAARGFLTADSTRFQYLHGAADPARINPDAWSHDQALLDRPGTARYQLDLLENYKTNVALYDAWHQLFRDRRPRTLIVWGENDPFFIPAGAQAYLADLPDAELIFLNAGHFPLEEYSQETAVAIVRNFG
jgi:pimeloyl-ACP methyl ester carboxylesterase